jgi:predicted Zn-dependent peptidase
LFYAYIGTQADKQPEAMKAMQKLLVDFPRSETGFEGARSAITNQMESERIRKMGILFSYDLALQRGLDHDIRKEVYEQTQKFTLDDIAKFQQQYIKKSSAYAEDFAYPSGHPGIRMSRLLTHFRPA